MELLTHPVSFSDKQAKMLVARELFQQAMAAAISGYPINGPEGVINSPRTNIYTILQDRRMSINPEGLATPNGMVDVVSWIGDHAPIRTFFSSLLNNFITLWYDGTPKQYEEICAIIGSAMSLSSPAEFVDQITNVAPVPSEINERMLPAADIRDQLKINRWLFIYYLFHMWGDIEKLSENDEPYQRALQRRVHTHRTPAGLPGSNGKPGLHQQPPTPSES